MNKLKIQEDLELSFQLHDQVFHPGYPDLKKVKNTVTDSFTFEEDKSSDSGFEEDIHFDASTPNFKEHNNSDPSSPFVMY